MPQLVREDRVEHRANRVRIVDLHPPFHEAVQELPIVENASAAVRVRRSYVRRFIDREVGSPNVVELRDDRFVWFLGGTRWLAAPLGFLAKFHRRRRRCFRGRARAVTLDHMPVIAGASRSRRRDARKYRNREQRRYSTPPQPPPRIVPLFRITLSVLDTATRVT